MPRSSVQRALLGLAVAAGTSTAWASPPGSNYRLVFADEFNGSTLDSSKWSSASPSWAMPSASASTASASMVTVNNGMLTLGGTRNGSASTFTSGSISSYQKFQFTSGYVEARIQLPSTVGSWPAFWGLYTGWPPEADIMEYPNTTDGGTDGLANNKYSTNYHYTNTAGAAAAGAGVVTTGSSLAGTTHTFGMLWTSNTSMAFYLDGTQVQSYTGSSVSQMAYMYMILDYAIGGWPGTPSLAQWPANFTDQTKVDWVRVWQTNPGNDAPTSWNINGGGAFGTSGNWTAGVPSYGNTVATFGRVGTASTAAITMNAWQVFGGITFDGAVSGTTAYTLGASGNAIQLATTSASGAVVQATSASTAPQTINASVEAWSNTTFRNDMTNGAALTLGGGVTGSGTVTIEGSGTVVFSASGNYTGGTTINGNTAGPAVLRASANAALGTGPVVIGANGNATTARLEIANSARLLNNVDFRGRTNATVGIENISGTNVLSGTVSTNVGGSGYAIQSDAGLLTISGASAGATVRGVAIQSTATGTRNVILQGAGSGVVSGIIRDGSGTVGITKAGAGTWTLSANNTYSGPTVISGGTLRLSTPASVALATPIASYTFSHVSGTTVINDGSGGSSMNGTLTGGSGTINVTGGPATGLGALNLNGSGTTVDINSGVTDLGSSSTWTLSTWIKTTQIGATILNKGDGTNWSSGFSTFYLGTGTSGGSGGVPDAVRWGGGWLAGSTTVNDGNWHLVTYTDAGGTKAIYVDGILESLTQTQFNNTDTGTKIRIGFAASNADGELPTNGSLSGINIYNTALSAAQVGALYSAANTVGGSAPLPVGTNVSIASGATLDVNGVTQTVASLSGPAGSFLTLGAGRLTINAASNGQFDGAISGAGSLVKSGTATFTLTGSNSFNGGVTLSAGTLAIPADAALGNTIGGVTFSGSSTLAPSSAMTLNRTISISAGAMATIDTGAQNVTLAGTISGFGALTKIGAGILALTAPTNSYTGDTRVNQGMLLSTNPIAAAGPTNFKLNSTVVGGSTVGAKAVFQGDGTQLGYYRGQIAASYASGAWTGNGVIGSTSAQSSSIAAVGYMDGGTYLTLHAGDATGFQAGYNVNASDMLLKYTYAGDADLSGNISLSDYALIDSGFLLGITDPTWANGDFNYDGVVDYQDYALIDAAFTGQSGTLADAMISQHESEFGAAYSAALNAALAAVPEPGSLGLVLAGVTGLMGRRIRKFRSSLGRSTEV